MPAVEDQTEEQQQPGPQEGDAMANNPPAPPASDPEQPPPPSAIDKYRDNPFPEEQTPDQQSATIPDQPAPPLPEQTPPPVKVLKQAPHTGFRGVLDRVLDAIAGTQGSQLYTDDQGNTFVQHPNLTEGQKWARVAGTLVGGAAHGWAAGRGGNPGAAAAAGFDTGMQMRKMGMDADDKNVATARQMNEDNINHQLLQQKIIENSFALKRMQTTATQQDMDHEQKMIEQEGKLGSIPLGTYTDANSLADVKKMHPGAIKDFYNTKNIVAINHVDEKTGQQAGVSLYLRRPGAGSQLLPAGTPFQVAELNPATHKYEYATRTSTEPITVDEKTARDSAAAAAMTGQAKSDADLKAKQDEATKLENDITAQPTEEKLKQEQIKNLRSEEAEHYSVAQKNKGIAEGTILPLTPDGKVDLTQVPPANMITGRQIAAGDQRVADLVGRGSAAQRLYWTQLAEAIDPTFAGQSFQTRQKTAQDYAPGGDMGKQIISFNQYLRHLQNVTDSIESLRNKNARWLNIPLNKLSSQAKSNPALAEALPSIIASRKELQSFLNGGHALHKEDIKDGQNLMDENMAPGAMEAAARGGATTAVDRLDEINNGYVRIFKKGVDGIVSPENAKTLRNFGLGKFLDRLNVMQPTTQQNNQTGPITVKDPRGSIHTFPNQQAADAFKTAAGIR